MAICTDERSRKRKQKKYYVQEFMNRETTNVEHKIYDHTINNKWSVRNTNKGLKNILEVIPGKHSIDHHRTQLY